MAHADFPRLRGARVLVVEDSAPVSELIVDLLTESGVVVVGPADTAQDGLRLASDEALDGALLDVTLTDAPSTAVAEQLRARGVPFAFLTGHEPVRGARAVTEEWVVKPFTAGELLAVADRLVGQRPPPA